MNRERALQRLANETFDIAIVGGGATGLGCALDACARGYRTALIEANDFASGTSSRSTKLIHGGVRYLQQGNVALVREALLERERLKANAPSLVREMRFVVPVSRAAEAAYYWAGLTVYDMLAGGSTFARSRYVRAREAVALIPGLAPDALRGAMTYSDAQFDDARLAIALAKSASARGAALANYVRAEGFSADGDALSGVVARDCESGERFVVRARAVVNAAGVFCDDVRRLDDPGAQPMLTFSRGSHIVLPARVLGSAAHALLVPKTRDGRVLFAIPWKGATLVGTTDVAASRAVADPQAPAEEVRFMLDALSPYVSEAIDERSVLSAWAGLRPLLRKPERTTARLSREHRLELSKRGLVTMTGGKWTTYRRMAQDAIDAAARVAGLAASPCRTVDLRLDESYAPDTDSLDERVSYYVREEMARTARDILERRTRTAFVDSAAAREETPLVDAAMQRTRTTHRPSNGLFGDNSMP